jgi:hypothetical protein
MGRRSQRWNGSASAGLISVQVVGEASSARTVTQTMDIECPGGAVIRLREDVSAEVLERVLRACQQVQTEGACVSGSVRSC